MKTAFLALAFVPVLLLTQAPSARAQSVVADSRGCGAVAQPAGPNASLVVDAATSNLCTNATGGGGGGGAVYGPTAVGSTAANPPVLTAGTANATATGNVQVIKVDSSGNQSVVGAETAGSAVTGGGVRIMGSDGTLARDVLTDTGGRIIVTQGVPNTSAAANAWWMQGNVASGATDSGNPVKVGGVYNSTLPTYTTGQRGDLQLTARGELNVQISSGGVAAAVSNSAADGVNNTLTALRVLNFGSIYNGTTWDRQYSVQGATAGAGLGVAAVGLVPSSAQTGLLMFTGSFTTTVQAVKASAGQVYLIDAGNSNASGVYIQLFNTASGSVTLGTTPPVFSTYIPATGGRVVPIDVGLAFSTAISAACTTTRAGNTAPGSSCDVNIGYR